MSRWLLVLLLPRLLFAFNNPVAPGTQEDTALFEKLSGQKGILAKDFFAKQALDPACRAQLDTARKAYQAEAVQLGTLKLQGDAHATDAQETKTMTARAAMNALVEKCGECVTNPVERRTSDNPQTPGTWYIADGSCQVPEADSGALLTAYQRLRESLLHIKQYSKKNPGGYFYVIDFYGVDPETGALSDTDSVEGKTTFDAFTAVLGPKLFLNLPTAFNYYFRNTIDDRKESSDTHLLMSFNAVDPGNFEVPQDISDVTASGKMIRTFSLQLTSVVGQWFLTSGGYLRYYTAALTPVSLQQAADAGRDVMRETLVKSVERSLGAR